MAFATSLPNAPSFPQTRSFPNARSATPPAQDWHAQWGGTFAPTDQKYSLGSGIKAPSPYFDPGSPLYGQTPPPLGGTPEASGPGGSAPAWQPMPGGGGGFTPLSQLGRGGTVGGGLDVRRAAEIAAQMAPPYGPDQYLGGTGYQARWKTGAAPPMNAPDATATGSIGGGMAPQAMVLLRAPNGQAKQVPADQVDHYLARGATRG